MPIMPKIVIQTLLPPCSVYSRVVAVFRTNAVVDWVVVTGVGNFLDSSLKSPSSTSSSDETISDDSDVNVVGVIPGGSGL